MELNEKDLEKVLSGIDRNVATEIAKENASLYRKKSIDELNEVKEKILSSKEKELTESELESVRAGQRR